MLGSRLQTCTPFPPLYPSPISTTPPLPSIIAPPLQCTSVSYNMTLSIVATASTIRCPRFGLKGGAAAADEELLPSEVERGSGGAGAAAGAAATVFVRYNMGLKRTATAGFIPEGNAIRGEDLSVGVWEVWGYGSMAAKSRGGPKCGSGAKKAEGRTSVCVGGPTHQSPLLNTYVALVAGAAASVLNTPAGTARYEPERVGGGRWRLSSLCRAWCDYCSASTSFWLTSGQLLANFWSASG